MSLLNIERLNKSFKSLDVLKDISMNIKKGERHAIIGPNGAGKTTLFNCITGTLAINSGKVQLDGTNISNSSSHHHVHLGMSRTFQKSNLFGDLTVRENIHLAVAAQKNYKFQFLKPLSKYNDLDKETMELLGEWDITERADVKVDDLSYGEQRLIEVILAMASQPRILLLDEPTSGTSPAETKQTKDLIQRLPSSVAVLVIEHDMDVVFSIADHITVLHHGEVILSGAPEDVRNSKQVNQIYFGGGAVDHA